MKTEWSDTEFVAIKMGEQGINVSCCYDFDDLVILMLGHISIQSEELQETKDKLKTVEAERDRYKESLRHRDVKVQEMAIDIFKMEKFIERAIESYKAFGWVERDFPEFFEESKKVSISYRGEA